MNQNKERLHKLINPFLSTYYFSLIRESLFFASQLQSQINNNKEATPLILYWFQENLAKPAAVDVQVQPPPPTSPKATSKLWDSYNSWKNTEKPLNTLLLFFLFFPSKSSGNSEMIEANLVEVTIQDQTFRHFYLVTSTGAI